MPLTLRISATALALLGTICLAGAQVNVTTYHNDNFRTGLNNRENLLNPATVNSRNFGLLFSLPVDGQVYAQPLLVSNVQTPSKGRHNIVYVATQHNTLYAFDADNNRGPNALPIWQTNFGTSVPNWDLGSGDVTGEIGICGTPVISIKRNAIYLIAKTKETDPQGNAIYVNRLHAVDLRTGKPKGAPTVIQATMKGTGEGSDAAGNLAFNSKIQFNRAGLVSVVTGSGTAEQETIYAAFGSHGDNGPYHGWVFSFDAATLKQKAFFNVSPNAKNDPSGYPLAAGGIWQGGAAPAADGSDLFMITGNGMFDPDKGSYGDAFIRLDGKTGLKLADYFAPSNQDALNRADADLGSGGALLLPAEVGSKAFPNLLIGAGKEGTIYLMDRTNLGKYGTSDKIVQELVRVVGGIWGMPAYFNKTVYFGGTFSNMKAFQIDNAAFKPAGEAFATTNTYGYPGPTPSVSSSGNRGGVVWTINTDAYNVGPAVLYAHDATKLGEPLYASSNTDNRDTMGGAIKFAVPTVANGKVYAGTANTVDVFGLGVWTEKPILSKPTGNYSQSVTVSITCPTKGSTIYYTLDGSTPTERSVKYTQPLVLTTSTSLAVKAFTPGAGASPKVQADYLIDPVVGNGSGLKGDYFNNSQDPTQGTPTTTQTDPTINFQWNGASPAAGVLGDNFAVKWTGVIQPLVTTTYTFSTNSDDGVKVTINNVKIIENMTYHAPMIDKGTITLEAGKKYPIEILFFQGTGGAVLQFFWSAPGLPNQIVPKSQLYPTGRVVGG